MGARSGVRCDHRHHQFYEGLKQGLLAYAKNLFRLAQPQEDKHTLREHFEAIERAGGYRPELHVEHEGPPSALYLMAMFQEISRGRGSSGFGRLPLSATEIASWCWLHRTTLTAFELEVIHDLDAAYLIYSSPEAPKDDDDA